MKYIYSCDICYTMKDWDNEIIWITSSYGVCEKCYNELTKEQLEEIREKYE